MRRSIAAVLLLSALASCQQPAPEVTVKDVWTRATPPGATNAAVFMTITSPTPDRLVAASTPSPGGPIS